jgi:protein-L-isoaspartate(D-aspartate) O-methyltransferase
MVNRLSARSCLALLAILLAVPAVLTAQEERQEERHAMVSRQIAARGVSDERVLEAMRTVPRHRFVPERLARSAYARKKK